MLEQQHEAPSTPAQIKPINYVADICAVLGRGKSWLFREWKLGRGPKRRMLGSSPVVTAADLLDYISNLPEAPPAPGRYERTQ